jgi:hypothetical protein
MRAFVRRLAPACDMALFLGGAVFCFFAVVSAPMLFVHGTGVVDLEVPLTVGAWILGASGTITLLAFIGVVADTLLRR